MNKEITDEVAFESAFHYSAVGMAFLDIDCRFLKINNALYSLLGYSIDDIINKHFKEITYPDDIQKGLDLVDQLLSGKKKSFQLEKRYYHKEGNIVWALLSVSLVFKDNGKPNFFIAQIQDISKRIIAQEKLRESKNLFDLAAKGARDGIWDWPDTRKDDAYWSSQWNKLVGYKDGELEQKVSVFINLLHPDDLEKTKKSLYNASEGKGRYDVEIRLKTKLGEYKWFQAKGIASPGKDQGTTRMTGSLTDINERKKTELLLKETQELFNLAVKGSKDGIWDWPDMDKDKGYWSPGFKKILGYEDHELEASTALFRSFVHPDDLDYVTQTVEKHLKTKIPFEAEYRVKTKSGKYKWIQARGIASSSKNPGSSRMTGSLTDISVRKEAEEKLAEHAKELERINEDLNSFAYIASHDLKEPIRGIYSNIIFLEQDFEGQLLPEVARRLGRMSYLCERMEKLTDDLLNYAKLKTQDLIIKRIDLNKVIQEIKNTIDKGSNNYHIEINIPRKIPKVICDEITVSELFRNLIHNGIKYNNNDIKIIEIGYEEIVDSDNIPKYAFYVKDNGVGIKKDDLDQIFHIFKRLDNTEDLVKGSGMGLSFVQRIIDRHNGKIWVDSEPGKGSIFHFTLN